MATIAQANPAPVERLIGLGWTLIELGRPEADAISEVVSAASSFFRLPEAEKSKCALGRTAGYRPYGIEYSNSPERPDEMETFSTTAISASSGSKLPAGIARDFHARTAVAFEVLEPLAEQLVVGLAEHLTNRASSPSLRGGLRDWSCIQVNHSYPNRVRSKFINELHEDGHFLTLAFATAEGLEIRQADGQFVGVKTLPNQMAVMLGGIAALMTDGKLSPLYHRVLSIPTCAERVSVMFFADLAPDLCLPWLAGATNRSIDVAEHVRANPVRFGLQRLGSE